MEFLEEVDVTRKQNKILGLLALRWQMCATVKINYVLAIHSVATPVMLVQSATAVGQE